MAMQRGKTIAAMIFIAKVEQIARKTPTLFLIGMPYKFSFTSGLKALFHATAVLPRDFKHCACAEARLHSGAKF